MDLDCLYETLDFTVLLMHVWNGNLMLDAPRTKMSPKLAMSELLCTVAPGAQSDAERVLHNLMQSACCKLCTKGRIHCMTT